jgi:hypothetical protein
MFKFMFISYKQLNLLILLTIIIYILYARGWLGIVVALARVSRLLNAVVPSSKVILKGTLGVKNLHYLCQTMYCFKGIIQDFFSPTLILPSFFEMHIFKPPLYICIKFWYLIFIWTFNFSY